MAYNKGVYDGQTLIDLTQDDVTASDVRSGVYFHDSAGVRGQGTLASTSVPTANTIAEWDSDAQMNSTDMSAQDVSDFVDSLSVTKVLATVETRELLWTNPAPNNDFAGTTINNVGVGYDYVEVETTDGMVRKGSSTIGHCKYGWANGGAVLFARSMTYDSTNGTLWCDNGVICGLANITSFTIDNSVCKPWKIYGIKLTQL